MFNNYFCSGEIKNVFFLWAFFHSIAMLSFSSKKKANVRPRLSCDASQRGAICWQVILEDSNQNTDCYLGISIDTIVLIEEHSRQIVFVTPCVSVLGWHAQTNR